MKLLETVFLVITLVIPVQLKALHVMCVLTVQGRKIQTLNVFVNSGTLMLVPMLNVQLVLPHVVVVLHKLRNV